MDVIVRQKHIKATFGVLQVTAYLSNKHVRVSISRKEYHEGRRFTKENISSREPVRHRLLQIFTRLFPNNDV